MTKMIGHLENKSISDIFSEFLYLSNSTIYNAEN